MTRRIIDGDLSGALGVFPIRQGKVVAISGKAEMAERPRVRTAGEKEIPNRELKTVLGVCPQGEVCERFLAALEKLGVTATLRREKGGDIDAACGQLRLKTERELAESK